MHIATLQFSMCIANGLVQIIALQFTCYKANLIFCENIVQKQQKWSAKQCKLNKNWKLDFIWKFSEIYFNAIIQTLIWIEPYFVFFQAEEPLAVFLFENRICWKVKKLMWEILRETYESFWSNCWKSWKSIAHCDTESHFINFPYHYCKLLLEIRISWKIFSVNGISTW